MDFDLLKVKDHIEKAINFRFSKDQKGVEKKINLDVPDLIF